MIHTILWVALAFTMLQIKKKKCITNSHSLYSLPSPTHLCFRPLTVIRWCEEHNPLCWVFPWGKKQRLLSEIFIAAMLFEASSKPLILLHYVRALSANFRWWTGWPVGLRKKSPNVIKKLPKNNLTRKIKYFNTFLKNCPKMWPIWANESRPQALKSRLNINKSLNLVTLQ